MEQYKFKRTGAQMDALFDEVAEGGKIYQTTFNFAGIERREDKSMTEEEWLEVNNIIAKYKAGYVVTIADSRDYPFRYGVINVTMMDDAVPVTLSVFNDQGDLMAYSVDGLSPGNLWTVTNKCKGAVKFITTDGLLDNTDSIEGDLYMLNSVDNAMLKELFNCSYRRDFIFIYTGMEYTGTEQQSVPLNIQAPFYYDMGNAALGVSFQHPRYGTNYKFIIKAKEDGSGFYANRVEEVSGGGSNIKKVTQAEYDAIANKEEILYVIIG